MSRETQPGRREVEKWDVDEVISMGEGIFKSALPLEKSFFMHVCCICHVLRLLKFGWEEPNRPICYSVFFMLLWFSGLMYLGHAHVKISYWSYFFFACIPTSEDLLDTKWALFKPFPCSSTGMLQSVLLKREKINHSCFVFFILNAWFWQWKQFVCLNCAADTFLLLFESYPPYFIQVFRNNSLKGQS